MTRNKARVTREPYRGPAERNRRGRPRAAVETPLSRWLDDARKTRAWAASRLHVTRQYIDRLARGSSRPSLDLAVKIEELTGGRIAVSTWMRPKARTRRTRE